MEKKEHSIYPIILCGGSGTRLWPLSRSSYPKQFLSLDGRQSFLQNTVSRLQTLTNIRSPIFICHEEHRFIVAEQVKALGISDPIIILEPVAKNTAPAVALAAHYIKQKDENAMLLVLAADHIIHDNNAFAESLRAASKAAEKDFLVTFGCKTTRTETGYGYILRGSKLADTSAYAVQAFVEKPDAERATAYHENPEYYWNSGMFLFPLQKLLDELEQHEPTLSQQCKSALENTTIDHDFVRIPLADYSNIKPNSIDYALMEKTKKAAVVALTSDWADVGDWAAWSQQLPADNKNNTIVGDVVLHDTENCHFQGSDRLIAAAGLQNIAVVDTRDALLLVDKSKTQDVKILVETLKLQERDETELPHRVYRPWGFYQVLNAGKNFQVKLIEVNPESSLSLQMHHHRNEHWIIVSGEAWVTKNEDIFMLSRNESTYIPKGARHRLENRSQTSLKFIEIQTGNYLGEDDIVRYDDVYGRDAEQLSKARSAEKV